MVRVSVVTSSFIEHAVTFGLRLTLYQLRQLRKPM